MEIDSTTNQTICMLIADIRDDSLSSDKKAKLIEFIMENKEKYDMIVHLIKKDKNELAISLLKRYSIQMEELDLNNFIQYVNWTIDVQIKMDMKKEDIIKDKDEYILEMVSDSKGDMYKIFKLFQDNKNLLKTFNKLPQDNKILLTAYVQGCVDEYL